MILSHDLLLASTSTRPSSISAQMHWASACIHAALARSSAPCSSAGGYATEPRCVAASSASLAEYAMASSMLEPLKKVRRNSDSPYWIRYHSCPAPTDVGNSGPGENPTPRNAPPIAASINGSRSMWLPCNSALHKALNACSLTLLSNEYSVMSAMIAYY